MSPDKKLIEKAALAHKKNAVKLLSQQELDDAINLLKNENTKTFKIFTIAEN